MIASTLYLPETIANVRYQHIPSRSICTDQTKCSVITGTIRLRLLVIASSQVFESCANLWDVLVNCSNAGLRIIITASPPARLVGVLAKQETLMELGRIKPRTSRARCAVL
jgi:hypothetical protein